MGRVLTAIKRAMVEPVKVQQPGGGGGGGGGGGRGAVF